MKSNIWWYCSGWIDMSSRRTPDGGKFSLTSWISDNISRRMCRTAGTCPKWVPRQPPWRVVQWPPRGNWLGGTGGNVGRWAWRGQLLKAAAVPWSKMSLFIYPSSTCTVVVFLALVNAVLRSHFLDGLSDMITCDRLLCQTCHPIR